VLGGGPIGCELGQAFARLGSRVTIVEMQDRLLPSAPAPAGRAVHAALATDGVDVRIGTRAAEIRPGTLSVEGPDGRDVVAFERILVATGRRPATDDLGLDTVGVDTDTSGRVLVDDTMRTTAAHVFAAGDSTGRMPFTHVAAAEGGLVVTNALFGARRTLDLDQVPWAVFTDPEVAHVGLGPAAARQQWGDDAIVVRFDHDGLDRAVTDNATGGFALLVADPRQRLVGATLVGEGAGESIAEMVAWLRSKGTLRDLGDTVHAYPTMTMAPWHAAREHLRTRLLSPTVKRLARPVLFGLRHTRRPRP